MSFGDHNNKHSQAFFYLPSQYLSDQNTITLDFNQFCYHPCQIAKFIINAPQNNKYNKIRLFKWISYAAFCHPVVVPYAQNTVEKIIGNRNIFQMGQQNGIGFNGQNIVNLLQAVNVFCLVKGFSLELLQIQNIPTIHPTLYYAHALWRNCLPYLTKNQLFAQCQNLITEVPKQPICELKNFINQLHAIRNKVTTALTENNYFQDNYRNMGSSSKQQVNIHNIDIQISKFNCLVSAEYLPDDYKGEYIQVWVNRTVELNSLLGNFVCKQKFGQFEYVKGPLMYAMEKGIMLVLNNFQHISNQLLIGMRTLAQQNKIFHNQKTLQARGGFKILGLCSAQRMSTKMKTMITNNQYIANLELPKRSVLKQIPNIQNQANCLFIIEKLDAIQQKLGLFASRKLWKRIQRQRKSLIQTGDPNKLWQSFFTQGFKDIVELQIMDLMSITDQFRTIHFQQKYNKIIIGRVVIDKVKQPSQKIVKTQYSLSILERLSLCSDLGETPLLISQTGCGKTTLVQYLAQVSGHHLYVYNMSSGTDVMDLVGGFKPIDCRSLLKQLFFRFIQKFRMIPGSQKNQQYLQQLLRLYNEDKLKRLLPSLSASIVKIKNKVEQQKQLRQWDQLKHKFDNIYANLSKIDSNLVFSFLEGNLIKALRNGDWVLIDQINMATNDVLQKIVPLIQGKSLLLYEKGDLTYIERHKDFRIIACMNPANDSGKKPLPPNLMQKFTAINLAEPSRMDVEMMIKQIAPQLNPSEIADIYFNVKKQKTVSLRNLSRCLSYLNRNKQIYTFKRALYDALLLGFQQKQLLKGYQDLTIPKPIPSFMELQGFLVQTGTHIHEGQPEVFHLTSTFLEHLKDFLRAIAGTQLPVLLQGPTSAGKTSIIRYVASLSAHNCIRINNHEHTQIQQYLGNYFPDKQGKLVFREGPLVKAVRQGLWLILDQLNLARTQILQCLNRLLDDNRQLFIPEQQIHIKPHKNFRIFATQNPASYSGRKTLSRAFRNRFISLSFDDITIQDTMAIMKVRRPILNDSKQLSLYVKKTLQSLQNYRQKQRVFSKDSIITIRDLLKWTGRHFTNKQSFMREAYALLVQRLRTQQQKRFVEEVLITGSKIEKFNMFQEYQKVINTHLSESIIKQSNIYVQMNKSFKRMAALTLKAAMNNQPVLLVGQTGCGKTTLAQLLASISCRKFYSINCHKHTEASDLLGCLRPCVKPNSVNKFQYVNGVVIDAMLDGAVLLIDQINTAEDSVLERLNQVLQSNNIGVQRGQGWQTVTAKQGFCIIATMNPSGDYGKKQLSPALRNRFTQIWVEPITHPQYIQQAQSDIQQMIIHKLSRTIEQVSNHRKEAANKIFNFIKDYNCIMAPKYGLTRKLLTMRDIGWVCKFMCECESQKLKGWEQRYYWAVRILTVEGVNFMMGDVSDAFKLSNLKEQLIKYINQQVSSKVYQIKEKNNQIQAISIVKQLTFPLLIKTDLPLQLLGIYPDQRIFFSPHTELSDLLGQFRPKGTQFIWKDQTLLKTVKNGQRIALMDLNLAQQPVIEGINSLFDHRGSIFVVQLNQMFTKNHKFKPIVVLKQTPGCDRRGLPNSFLNRFIKIRVKDVSNDIKMKYLQKKYKVENSYRNYDDLWNYISKVLMQNPKTKIESLEYVCELYNKDQSYLQKSSKILSLASPLVNKKILQQLPSEQKVLKILPLTPKYETTRSKQNNFTPAFTRLQKINEIQCLINSYITLTCSKFSICLIGSVTSRQNMVNWIGYMLSKNVVKVMLSTMTDMADLLGSYEQVQDGLQKDDQSQMQDEQQQYNKCNTEQIISKYLKNTITKYNNLIQTNFATKQKNNTNKNTTALSNFKYIQSQIIKTLQKSQNNILYIEVPNQTMLQRVQKGIKDIYEQNVSVIVGLDSTNTANIITNTKFIPINLDLHTYDLTSQNNSSSVDIFQSSSTFFTPNLTNLTHLDQSIRLDETQNWIQHNCRQESNRNMVKAWQRLYLNIKNNKLSYNSVHDQLYVKNKIKQISTMLWTHIGLEKQYKQNIQSGLNIQQKNNLLSKQFVIVPSSKIQSEVLQKILVLFTPQKLTSNHAILKDNNNIDIQSQRQQQNHQQISNNNINGNIYNCTYAHKFQYLYLCDNGTFKQQTLKLLNLCYNNISHATDSQAIVYKTTIQKLQHEIQTMYRTSTSQYSQILINYSNQQYKLIPILKPTRQSLFHYALTNIPWSVNKLAGLDIDLSVIAHAIVENYVVQYMGYVEIDSKQIADWIWRVNIRELPMLEIIEKRIIQDKLDYFKNVGQQLKNSICNNSKLYQTISNIISLQNKNKLQQIQSQLKPLKSQQILQFAYSLFNAFKPSTSIYQNLILHIQTQSQLKTLLSLSEQDKYYLDVYQKLCLIKYNGYQPNSFKNIQIRINQYKKQYQEIIAKQYVYRGYDNLKMLKQFYENLVKVCTQLETSGFDSAVVKEVMNELYRRYYTNFKDIVWPILVSLIIIHSTQLVQKSYSLSKPSIVQSLLSYDNNHKSFQRALQLILNKQQQQYNDAAKSYLKFQRKFKNTVIVDQYTEEGVAKNKQNEQEQFKQFFGKSEVQKPETILDQLYMLIRKRVGCKYELKLLKSLFNQCRYYQQLIVGFELKFSNTKHNKSEKLSTKTVINIYEQYSLFLVNKLCTPIPTILQQTKKLLSKYNIDTVKAVGTLCNKIQQHKAHDQVYKILVDCQFLIQKIYELIPILPMSERISTQQLESLCISVRKIELQNWKSMLQYKISRVEKSDTIDFIHFYRNFVQIGNIGQNQYIQGKQCFRMCDDFMRQSKISCYEYRLYLLTLLSQNFDSSKPYIKHNINRIVKFYSSLRQPIMQYCQQVKKQKIKQMNQYEKLTKWDSNNFLIFKQTCQRFQKKIHKILKRYEEQLAMQIGVFHTNFRNKQICQSIQDFSTNYKMKQESQRIFSEINLIQQQQKQNINNYQGVVERIFQTIQQIKQQHHNTQSKLLLIRNNLADLQELTDNFTKITTNSNNLSSQVISEEMFVEQNPQYYTKAVKYYFGMWDKLCQKTQTAWNREIVQRIWTVAEKIWVNINSRIPKYVVEIQTQIDEQTDNILMLFDRFINEEEGTESNHHPIFKTQLTKIKNLLRQKHLKFYQNLGQKYTKIQKPEQTICLMKIGYLISSIALNLQKNGLCVKENQQEGQQSGTQEVGDGVGIGQGQAHEGAENVGDQIQFQEQLQGNKDEQKNKDANANNKQQNDIQMEGDFEGDMYSKQQQAGGEDQDKEAQQKQADQQMGEVDNKQRQQDMKNDKGRADGDQQADVEIDGQQQGSQQLVDNQKQQKQARKGQNRQQQSEGQQNQKSDWDDNNQQGEKINKQDVGEMQQQEQMDKDGSVQSLSSIDHEGEEKMSQNQNNQEEIQGEDISQSNKDNQMQDQNEEQKDIEGDHYQSQINEQSEAAEQPQNQKQKKFKKTRRTNIQAFGRQDLNSNNPLKNNQMEAQNEQKMNNDGAAQAAGANQGQKGTGEPIHSLSAQLLKEIQNLERVTAKQNANFMKDLNVVSHDENNQQIQQAGSQQQYQLTQEQNKLSTNLPAFLDSQNKKQQQNEKNQQINKQRKQQKQVKKDTAQKDKETNKSKLQKSKIADTKQQIKQENVQQFKSKQKPTKKQGIQKNSQKESKKTINKQSNVLSVNVEQYLKSIVNANINKDRDIKKQTMKDQNQQTQGNIMEEAFQISKILEEQLKSVLEPMDNAQYRGDYKTGKKLNLKKIIPFIASNYRKDKIWLRRTQPSQRNYYVMLALDDTKSMHHGGVGIEALKGLLAISYALQHLSIKTCITGIRDSMNIYKNFQGLLQPNKIIRNFDFTHESQVSHDLSIASFMQASLQQFARSQSSETGVENKQLCFIISDGKMNKDYVRPYLRQAKKKDIIYVFIIVDSQKGSILTTKSVSIDQNGKVKMKLYMSDFPFEYFLIVRNVRELGDVLASTLLQFIQEK